MKRQKVFATVNILKLGDPGKLKDSNTAGFSLNSSKKPMPVKIEIEKLPAIYFSHFWIKIHRFKVTYPN
jgi:hypothetical protein